MDKNKIGVLLADKCKIFRQGLARLLQDYSEIEVVDLCDSGLQAVESSIELRPDIVILDTELTECNTVEVIHNIIEQLPGTKVIMLTHSEEGRDLLSAIATGAMGYISKNISIEDLVKIIALASTGELVVSPPMTSELLDKIKKLDSLDVNENEREKLPFGLSIREAEILTMVRKGYTNKEIATTLFIAENTVKVHMRNIMEKSKIHNRTRLASLST